MSFDPRNLIAIRRREIQSEISRLSDRIRELQKELPELEVAERVMGRLADDGTGSGEEGSVAAPERDEALAFVAKPPGTPTIPEMIFEALKDAASKGSPGLQPAGMTSFIAGRWWPEVPGVAVSPIAWRMWKRGQLVKDGPIYKLPTNNDAAPPLLTEGTVRRR